MNTLLAICCVCVYTLTVLTVYHLSAHAMFWKQEWMKIWFYNIELVTSLLFDVFFIKKKRKNTSRDYTNTTLSSMHVTRDATVYRILWCKLLEYCEVERHMSESMHKIIVFNLFYPFKLSTYIFRAYSIHYVSKAPITHSSNSPKARFEPNWSILRNFQHRKGTIGEEPTAAPQAATLLKINTWR